MWCFRPCNSLFVVAMCYGLLVCVVGVFDRRCCFLLVAVWSLVYVYELLFVVAGVDAVCASVLLLVGWLLLVLLLVVAIDAKVLLVVVVVRCCMLVLGVDC